MFNIFRIVGTIVPIMFILSLAMMIGSVVLIGINFSRVLSTKKDSKTKAVSSKKEGEKWAFYKGGQGIGLDHHLSNNIKTLKLQPEKYKMLKVFIGVFVIIAGFAAVSIAATIILFAVKFLF